MRPKTAKNRRYAWLLLACLVGFGILSPVPAQAYTFDQPVTIDAVTGEVCPGVGLTRRMMPCIKDTIIYATYAFLVPFSTYLGRTIATACVLAVAVWGFLMVTGRKSAPVKDLAVLLIKIGAIVMMTANFGGLFPLVLDAMEYMLTVVSTYALYASSVLNSAGCPNFSGDPGSLIVWDLLDCTIETLVGGVFSPFSLTMGISGFLVACLFSSAAGFFIALIGFYLILQFLQAIARALYIFISAYIAFALMIIISPLFIPLILFRNTKSFFEKWLRMTIGFILQPIFLFAYLSMLIAAFDVVVYSGPNSLYRAIAGNDVDLPGFEMGGWLLGSSAYVEKSQASQGVNVDPGAVKRTPKLNNLGKEDTGVLGTVGEQETTQADWWVNGVVGGAKKDIFQFLGVGDNGNDLRFFKVDLPTEGVDWDWLAFWNGAPDTTSYIVSLFLAAFMALITGFIFLTMLDYLPYIGQGISDISLNLPTFGVGRMAPPGANVIEGLREKMGKAMGGGK